MDFLSKNLKWCKNQFSATKDFELIPVISTVFQPNVDLIFKSMYEHLSDRLYAKITNVIQLDIFFVLSHRRRAKISAFEQNFELEMRLRDSYSWAYATMIGPHQVINFEMCLKVEFLLQSSVERENQWL